MFSCEYCEIFKNSFFIEQIWWLLLIVNKGNNNVAPKTDIPFSKSHNSFSKKQHFSEVKVLHEEIPFECFAR